MPPHTQFNYYIFNIKVKSSNMATSQKLSSKWPTHTAPAGTNIG